MDPKDKVSVPREQIYDLIPPRPSKTSSYPKRRMKASGEQLTYLYEYMKKHPQILKVTGAASSLEAKVQAEKHWVGLTKKLNNLPGPAKNVSKWKQAWRDMRNNLKRKTQRPEPPEGDFVRHDDNGHPPPSTVEVEVDAVTASDNSVDAIKIMFGEEPSSNTNSAFLLNPPSSPSESSSASSSPRHSSPEAGKPRVRLKVESASEEENADQMESQALKDPIANKKKQKLTRKLESLLHLEREKINIEKERNKILTQKNTIAAEKVAALNRLTDVLQGICSNLLNK